MCVKVSPRKDCERCLQTLLQICSHTDVATQLQYLKDFVLQGVGLPSNQCHRWSAGMGTDSTGFLPDLDTSTHLMGAHTKGQGLGVLPTQVIFPPPKHFHL